MAQFTQIYEKTLPKSLSFFAVYILLASCVSQSTSLFELRDQNDLQSFELSEYGEMEIQKSSVYYFGIFTTGEYDKFESNIFDQLRVSLHSEARFRYPEYELVNVKQLEEYRLFKTTYTVKGELISKYLVKQKMDLMTRGIVLVDSLTEKATFSSAPNFLTDSAVPDTIVFDKKAKSPKGVSSRFALEGKEVAEALEQAKQSLDTLKDSDLQNDSALVVLEVVDTSAVDAASIEVAATVLIPLAEEDPATERILEPVASNVMSVEHVSAPTKQVHEELEEPEEYPKEEKEDFSPKNTTSLIGTIPAKTVYIVACFKLDGFVEEKVTITQEEIGHPLAYYRTDKWIRVYLDAEFTNVQEAKQVWREAWPITFGR